MRGKKSEKRWDGGRAGVRTIFAVFMQLQKHLLQSCNRMFVQQPLVAALVVRRAGRRGEANRAGTDGDEGPRQRNGARNRGHVVGSRGYFQEPGKMTMRRESDKMSMDIVFVGGCVLANEK